ncbi:MAG: SUMF1/EgtB/PvdO family nonheme iron enzyme [Anaerolineales bacterium]|nr:MAG: SUMF1/EgtB/PvdO family nonheme iron enzyme [Anaerolineales bacterium]
MPKRKYQTPEVLHDAPLAGNKRADFYFDDFAATFARLIASPTTDTPLAIGINGAWGSGKTSLLLRIKDMLDNPLDEKGAHRFAADEENKFRQCKTVWFDAWKYNDEDELLVALVRVILHHMERDGLSNNIKVWLDDPTEKSYDIVAMFLNAFQVSFGPFKFQPDLKKHEEDSPFAKYTAFFDHFDEAFGMLLKAWSGKDGTLVIFIDDLDRCLPAKTVQTLEAIKLFLDKSGCVFVLGADTRIVRAAVETHYKNEGIIGEGAKDYLEKIIQLRFDLPPIFEKAMENFLKTQDKTKVDEAMLKRWQALVAAAEVNPRRVKNVINDLNLQWFMAVNSGQAEGVNRDDFICWQALLRAAPSKFVAQVTKFDDQTVRHNFVLDALKWQNGKQEDKDAVKGFFADYEDDDSRRLRKVLKEVSFSGDFTPETLDAMIYMTAPPPKPEPVKPTVEQVEKPLEAVQVGEGVSMEGALESEMISAKRGAVAPRGEQNELEIGGIRFVRVPKGRFVMGSKEDNELAFDSEKPQHTIELAYDYWMAKFTLTNEQYAEFLGNKKHPVPDWQKKKNHPVVYVSWNDTAEYCTWFNETYQNELKEAGGLVLHLPTEAEWEKAARGVYGNEWPWGNRFDLNKCNSAEGRKGGTTPVGAYSSLGGDSPYGCADMAGNVWEWCSDWFSDSESKSRSATVSNPKGRQKDSSRVLRGGSFSSHQYLARCAYRFNLSPDDRVNSIGFRLVVSPSISEL